MLTLHLYNPETNDWQTGDLNLLQLPLHGDQKAWIDLSTASHAEQQHVLNRFQIHPVIAEDYLRERHPPKLEAYDGFTLLILPVKASTNIRGMPSSRCYFPIRFCCLNVSCLSRQATINSSHLMLTGQ